MGQVQCAQLSPYAYRQRLEPVLNDLWRAAYLTRIVASLILTTSSRSMLWPQCYSRAGVDIYSPSHSSLWISCHGWVVLGTIFVSGSHSGRESTFGPATLKAERNLLYSVA